MAEKKLSRSIKKYIRLEKSRIRREFLDIKKQKELIEGLCKKFLKAKQNLKESKNLVKK